LFICCESNDNSDRFFLPDINSMEELKKYAKDNIPIESYLLYRRYKRTIYLKEDVTFVHLYLNNYLHYYEIIGYLGDQKMIQEVDNYCKSCSHHSDYDWECTYIKNDSGCKNYKEKTISIFVKLMKKLF